MRLIHIIALILSLAGCGSDDDSDSSSTENALQGSWWIDGASCSYGIIIQDKAYRDVTFCPTSSNSANAEIEEGTFALEGDAVVITAERGSCATRTPKMTMPYQVTDTTLTLTRGANTLIFSKYVAEGSEPSNGAVLTTGCFSADGTAFTPREVQ